MTGGYAESFVLPPAGPGFQLTMGFHRIGQWSCLIQDTSDIRRGVINFFGRDFLDFDHNEIILTQEPVMIIEEVFK